MTIFEEVKRLGLPLGEYVVFGSGPLAARGIRDSDDIDLFVTSRLYEQLKAEGWPEQPWPEGGGRLVNGDVEADDTWNYGDYRPTPEEVIARAELINGVPFAPLTEVLAWKRAFGRDKDLHDIELIQDFMSNRPNVTGRILLIGPSRAGKSYLASAFRIAGLAVVDTDKETSLIKWRDDATGQPVTRKPAKPSKEWFQTHHFLIDKQELSAFLASRTDVIMLAHCWNIMDCLDLFDETYLMYVAPAELERRMALHRPDHSWQGSKHEVDFMLERHAERQAQARALNIPFLDVSGDAAESLRQLVDRHEARLKA